MLFKIALFLSFLILPPPPAIAQDNTADAQYAAMVDQSLSMPADFDFAAVRDLYKKTSIFSPYTVNARLAFEAFTKRSDAAGAGDVAAYIKQHFALPEVHTRAMTFYKKIGDTSHEQYHAWASKGLLQALKNSGNAGSPEQAIDIINASEEYLIARQHGKIVGQRIEEINGRTYDVLTIRNEDTRKRSDLWFDITDITGKGL